jgi:hypothetical protein
MCLCEDDQPSVHLLDAGADRQDILLKQGLYACPVHFFLSSAYICVRRIQGPSQK